MNAKKKNKKANKAPNPNPPQNVEGVMKKEEKIEELTPKSEDKKYIFPPVITSDVAKIPVSDFEDIESETPKKPKRNKGKNKKQDKEEKMDVQEIPQEVQTEFITKVEGRLDKIATDDKGCEAKEHSLGEINLPSGCKKKNKKKTQDQKPVEEPIQESKTTVDPNITTLLKEESIEKIDTEIQELFSSKPEMPKQEGKKKKNKNKNRSDSEKSDKSDNILSCTSAFQNILLTDDLSKQENFDNTTETKEFLAGTTLESDTINIESTVASAVETKTVEKIKETNVNLVDTKELPKTDNKGKKKNKKDKKQQQKEIYSESKNKLAEEISLPAEELMIQTILISEPRQDKEPILISFDVQKELSPKPIARISKPVEKKRKGNSESGLSENVVNIESSEIMSEAKKLEELRSEIELKPEEITAANVIEIHGEGQSVKPHLINIPNPIENINVPSDHTIGKKRKKSPKPRKINENKYQSKEEINIEKTKTEDISETKESTEIYSELQPGIEVAISDPVEALLMHDAKTDETFKIENESVLDLTQTKSLESSLTPEMAKDNEGFEIKINKKKKKMPKVPQIEPTSEVKGPVVITKVEDQKQISNEPKQISEEQSRFPVESCIEADIEVQNITTASEAASYDFVPDVQFIRSSSQQLLDRNNNTVIQEVINVEDVKLSDQQLMPLIEGSGATPARSPEPVSSGIKLSEIGVKTPTEEKTDVKLNGPQLVPLIESSGAALVCSPEQVSSGIILSEIGVKTPTEEKTDIKSKMMEVNQDMEELRLSIERSLAEFTALEKYEKETEKVPELPLGKEKLSCRDDKKQAKQIENIISDVKENIPEVVEIKESEKSPSLIDETFKPVETPPVCPVRKDNKNKNKSRKKGKQDASTTAPTAAPSESSKSQTKDATTEEKKEEPNKKSEQKSESAQEKGKQQSTATNDSEDPAILKDTSNENNHINSELVFDITDQTDFESIDNFEDALTSSIDDVNKTFEMIAKEADNDNIEFQKKLAANKPEINITTVEESDANKNEKVNPVSQPKNLLGHTDIPVQSNKPDYKKEKNKTPNARQARVKIKDSTDIECEKQSKESQTDNKRSRKITENSAKESFSRVKNDNEEYVYKYSFRKVFLQSACHVCNKGLSQARVPCGYCNLIFYCGAKHKEEDWPHHQALCFAVSTLAHMKDQKHIYADAANTTGQDYRLLRMQMIVSCEKVLKRRLVPWEQELMLYPRICADVGCREWRQGKLKDCDGCGQLSFCADHPDHLPKSHSRWCKSYSLYQKLVTYQQTKGRLEPRLPTRMLEGTMPGKMNEVLAAMYEEKIDMNDIQYASLTQLATAPLTTSYCIQLCRNTTISNGVHKHPFTIHVVGAELQFEADALNKWETFFLHLRPDVEELRVVLVSPQLNPGNLPLDLLGKIKLCDNCQQNKRRVIFKFEDNKNYFDYRSSEDYINPDIICAFNPSIQRSSIYNGKDPWPASINTILKLKVPFIISAYTLNELRKDLARIKQVSELDFKLVSEPVFNSFASVRPDRNFISDDEMPLLFKNYCVAVVLGC